MTRSSPELAILVPVKGRPHRMEPLLDSIGRATPTARVVFLPDPSDAEVQEAIMAVTPHLSLIVECAVLDGNYAAKINHGVRITEEPFLFFGADDLDFRRSWYDQARARARKFGVVATNDQANARVMAGRLATHPLVTREYAERATIDNSPGPLCEKYPHEYVDREFSEVAQSRGEFAYAPTAVVEHLHPMVGKAPMDDSYRQARFRMRVGCKIYNRRRRLWNSPS